MSWNPLLLLQNLSPSPALAGPSLHFRVVTHNVRYAASDLFTNERPWPERFPLILSQLHHELRHITITASKKDTANPGHASFVCLQEVLHQQLVDILAGLNHLDDHQGETPPNGPFWAHVGVGRDDGERKGEYSPILYPVKTFKLLHQETVWLSPTPSRPSKGWDAGSIRILTLGVFEHTATARRVIAANTHLDNAGPKSRHESIAIILETLRRTHSKWARGQERLGLFLAGDFNSLPTQEAYKAVKDSGYLFDVHDMVNSRNRYGDIITFTGFEPEKDRDEQGRIDFIWIGPVGEGSGDQDSSPWTVDGYAVLPNLFENGTYLSDHRAVVGDLTLR